MGNAKGVAEEGVDLEKGAREGGRGGEDLTKNDAPFTFHKTRAAQ